MVFAALRVVTTKNIVHAALYLVLVLAGVAGLYILLAAEFVAITQVLVYIGAIVVLFLFGIMLTRAPHRPARTTSTTSSAGSARRSSPLLLGAVMGYALIDEFGGTDVRDRAPSPCSPTTAGGRDSIFSHLPGPVRGRLGAPARRAHRRHRRWPGGTERHARSTSSSCSPPSCSASASTACSPAATACMVLMSIELILNAVNINLVAFGAFHGTVTGQVFALFVIAVAAAEVGVGLAIVLLIYRNRRTHRPRRGRPDEGLIGAMMQLAARLAHPGVAVRRPDPAVAQSCWSSSAPGSHPADRRRLVPGHPRRRQAAHVQAAPSSASPALSALRAVTSAPAASGSATRRRHAARRDHRATPTPRPAPGRPRRRRDRGVGRHRGREPGRRRERRRDPARRRGAAEGEREEHDRRPVVHRWTWFAGGDIDVRGRHPRRRPVGDDAVRRHAHLAAGAHLLAPTTCTATALHALLRLPRRCSRPRCSSSSWRRTRSR